MRYFTADPHFGDDRIIKYCCRPFKNPYDMNHGIISYFNSVLTPEDELYILGDLSIAHSRDAHYLREIIQSIKGVKHLILGNHDKLDPFEYLEVGFKTVHTALKLEDGRYGAIGLIHDPAPTVTDRGHPWLVGHVHDLFKGLPGKNVVNVGVDVWGFRPVLLSEALAALA